MVLATALLGGAYVLAGWVQRPGEALAAPEGLPLVIVPAEKPRALAVFLSGDGGWRALERRMTAVLTQADVGVVGLDSLGYFWAAKTPERVAADLERIIAHYTTAWRVHDVLFIGYSFGADVLPAALNRMDRSTRERIVEISLLGVAREAEFEFTFGAWLGLLSGDKAQPVAPEAARLDMATVQCFFGEREDDSLCRDAVFRDAERVETEGGHHFGSNYDALARRVLAGYHERSRSGVTL